MSAESEAAPVEAGLDAFHAAASARNEIPRYSMGRSGSKARRVRPA